MEGPMLTSKVASTRPEVFSSDWNLFGDQECIPEEPSWSYIKAVSSLLCYMAQNTSVLWNVTSNTCLPSTPNVSPKHNENTLVTHNFKQATLQNYRTRYYEQYTRDKKMEMDWPCLKKERWQCIQSSTKMDTCLKKKTWTTQNKVEEDRWKRPRTTTFDLGSGCKSSCRQDNVKGPCFCTMC